MAKRMTSDQKQAAINQIDAYRKEGMGLLAACKKAGVIDKTYYSWRSSISKLAKEAAPRVHKLVDSVDNLSPAPAGHQPKYVLRQTQVAVVLCSPEQLKQVLHGII